MTLTNNKTIKQKEIYMLTIIVAIVAGAAGFVGGILVGRKNKALVEKELTAVKDAAAKAGVKL